MRRPIAQRLRGALIVLLTLASTAFCLSMAETPAPAQAGGNICRDVPCKYRVVNFDRGSRKYNAITREIRLRPRTSDPLPTCDHYRIRVFSNGSGAVTRCGHDWEVRPTQARFGWDWVFDPGFWTATVSIAWKITKCVSYVLIALVPVAKVYRVIRTIGTIRKVARIIVEAGSMTALKEETPALFMAISGINGIASNCF